MGKTGDARTENKSGEVVREDSDAGSRIVYRASREFLKRVNIPTRFMKSGPKCKSDEDRDYKLRKMMFDISGFNRYGLYSHDVWDTPVVAEALRRAPKDIIDARNFRLIRALQTDTLRIHLPKEKWITYEQDLEYRYLTPYVQEIEAEWQQIRSFDTSNYSYGDWPTHEPR